MIRFSRFTFSAIIPLGIAAVAFRAAAQTPPPDFQITPEERSEVIKTVIAKLNEIYVFPETAKKMEDAIRARAAKKEYDEITSARDFARKVTNDLREVSRDKHLGLRSFREGAREPSANGPSLDEIKAQRPFMEKLNFGFEKVERMQGNVLKTLKRATLIGETTGGGAHPSRPVKVSEHFMLELPYARAVNPVTRTNWEGTGVQPDIEKPADQALDSAYWAAIEKIVSTTDNPRQKEQLQRMLDEKKAKETNPRR